MPPPLLFVLLAPLAPASPLDPALPPSPPLPVGPPLVGPLPPESAPSLVEFVLLDATVSAAEPPFEVAVEVAVVSAVDDALPESESFALQAARATGINSQARDDIVGVSLLAASVP